jgi:spore germination cell wall hydrolase CwlJ-like protein
MANTFSFKFKKIRSAKLGNIPIAVVLVALLGTQMPVMPHANTLSMPYYSWSAECALKEIQRDLRKLTPAQAYQVDMMARTVYGEGRGEGSLRSLEAIAHVIMNRAKDENKRWPTHIVGVVKQKLQFSCWNSNDPNAQVIKKVTLRDSEFRRCYRAVLNAVRNKDGVRGANHYHTVNVSPDWAKDSKMVRIAQIGNHVFYRA